MIGIAGNATVGKDSFYRVLRSYLEYHNVKCARFALADNLKNESRHEIYEKIGISTFTQIPEEKEKVRPYLVEFAARKRQETQGQYLTSKLEDEVNLAREMKVVPILTDLRFAYYERDELWWLKTKHKGKLVYLDRIDDRGEFIKPANLSEEENNPKLRKAADYYVCWPTRDETGRRNFIEVNCPDVLKGLLNYCRRDVKKEE